MFNKSKENSSKVANWGLGAFVSPVISYIGKAIRAYEWWAWDKKFCDSVKGQFAFWKRERRRNCKWGEGRRH